VPEVTSKLARALARKEVGSKFQALGNADLKNDRQEFAIEKVAQPGHELGQSHFITLLGRTEQIYFQLCK